MGNAILLTLNERGENEKLIAERADCFDVERVTMEAC